MSTFTTHTHCHQSGPQKDLFWWSFAFVPANLDHLLKVPTQTLDNHGSVSSLTAINAMESHEHIVAPYAFDFHFWSVILCHCFCCDMPPASWYAPFGLIHAILRCSILGPNAQNDSTKGVEAPCGQGSAWIKRQASSSVNGELSFGNQRQHTCATKNKQRSSPETNFPNDDQLLQLRCGLCIVWQLRTCPAHPELSLFKV